MGSRRREWPKKDFPAWVKTRFDGRPTHLPILTSQDICGNQKEAVAEGEEGAGEERVRGVREVVGLVSRTDGSLDRSCMSVS